MEIIRYDEEYRDDMIFMLLLSKDAIGRKPHINDDLLDIKREYLQNGDFMLATEGGRVIACGGYKIKSASEAVLHRLYVKPGFKCKGIGSSVLKALEDSAKSKGISTIYVHTGKPREVFFESYAFYEKHGYKAYIDGVCDSLKKEITPKKTDTVQISDGFPKKLKLTVTESRCRCAYHKKGDEFIVGDICPPICHELWNAIYPSCYALLNGAELDYGDKKAKMFDAKCPDEGRVCIHGEIIE